MGCRGGDTYQENTGQEIFISMRFLIFFSILCRTQFVSTNIDIHIDTDKDIDVDVCVCESKCVCINN